VLKLERKWLATVPWQAVVTKNQALCLKDHQPHELNPDGFEDARRLWEGRTGEVMELREVLDVFRQVHRLAPFKFFNGNTVAAVARDMMTEVVAPLPSLQAEMACRTVAHYVVGAIKAGEVNEVLKHVASLLRNAPPLPPSAAPFPSPAS
jgi:hypothetical protein